ncbi:hypothetical protein GGF32_006849 [Allomyces javanicus]|nr:hypothetical protein GGF32_006849 [Allomyces javanicus]
MLTQPAAGAQIARFMLARTLLYMVNFIVDLYLPFNVPASPSFRWLSAVLGPGFHPLNSVAAVALAVERVFAFRKSAFHEALAAMDPRPPIAVSFMAPRINSRVDDFRGRWVGSLPPFVAVTVHFLTPDWNLVSHVAEFKTAAPGSTETVEAVWNVVCEFAPDPRALLCGVTAAANAESATVLHALQIKLHELVRDNKTVEPTNVAAQPCFAHALHGIAAAGVAAFRPSSKWLDALLETVRGTASRVYDRHWKAAQRTNPDMNEEHHNAPFDEPGKWTRANNAQADWVVFDKAVAIFELLDDALKHVSAPS